LILNVLSENDAKTANMPGGIYKNLLPVTDETERKKAMYDAPNGSISPEQICRVVSAG
jgi:hypothetical protein